MADGEWRRDVVPQESWPDVLYILFERSSWVKSEERKTADERERTNAMDWSFICSIMCVCVWRIGNLPHHHPRPPGCLSTESKAAGDPPPRRSPLPSGPFNGDVRERTVRFPGPATTRGQYTTKWLNDLCVCVCVCVCDNDACLTSYYDHSINTAQSNHPQLTHTHATFISLSKGRPLRYNRDDQSRLAAFLLFVCVIICPSSHESTAFLECIWKNDRSTYYVLAVLDGGRDGQQVCRCLM